MHTGLYFAIEGFEAAGYLSACLGTYLPTYLTYLGGYLR